jgi:hypothetical protein
VITKEAFPCASLTAQNVDAIFFCVAALHLTNARQYQPIRCYGLEIHGVTPISEQSAQWLNQNCVLQRVAVIMTPVIGFQNIPVRKRLKLKSL